MKKRVLSQIALFLVLLAGLLFTGCENFLNGDEIKDAVVDAIQYGNSPYYSIRVEAVKGSGTIKGNEEVSKRVSDTFTVRFDPDENHQFIRWEAVIPNLGIGESISDYIVFEDAESLETNVTFKKANNNILLRPVCPKKLKVSINLSSEKNEEYPRDSVIALTFTEEIADECLDNISIDISDLPEGKTFRDYYKAPEKSGNLVIFNPKIDWENVNENDLIPMEENELKTISVQLPISQIFYENTNYSSSIVQYLEDNSKLPFTFIINSKINEAPAEIVTVEGSHGKFTPAKGEYRVQQFQKSNIEFEPDSDFEFIRWQIYNTETDEEIPDGLYIKIADVLSEKTSYTLIQLPENEPLSNNGNEGNENSALNTITLAIRPLICERPRIISYSPSYSAAGVLKKTSIQVMFDYDMDPNSIYYTKNEYDALSLEGYQILKTSVGGEERCYGYIKDGETYFKNISITNSRNNANLAERFNPPVFENARTLAIPVQTPLSPGMNVTVTIETEFFRSVEYNSDGDKIPVIMSRSERWMYLVNGESDTTDPIFGDGYPKVYDSAGNQITATAQPSADDAVNLKYLKGGEFKLALRVSDNPAPSTSFNINLKRVYDASYNVLTTPARYVQTKDYTTSYGVNAVYGDENSGDDLVAESCILNTTNLPDGVYGISFTIKDTSENSATSPADSTLYYFCLDNTPPDMSAPAVSDGTTAQSLVLSWNTTGVRDYKDAKFKWRKWGSSDIYSTTDEPVTENTYTITGLTEGTHYEIIAEYSDLAGNVISVPVTGGAYTRPAPPKTVTFAQNYGTTATVTGAKPEVGNCSNLRVRYSKNGTSAWTEFGSRITYAANSETGSISFTPEKGYKYDVEVCTYDSASGKYSFAYSTSTSGTTYPLFTAPPNQIRNFSLETRDTTSMGISWSAPEGNCTGYIIKCSTNNSFPNNSTTKINTITTNSTTTTTFTDLTPGTPYYFRVLAYYDVDRNTTSYDSGPWYSKCAAVTNLQAVSASNSSINVSWTAPSGSYSSYKLYYKKHTDSSYSSITVNSGVTSTTLTGLEGGISYDIYLQTVGLYSAQNNSTSTIADIKTHPNPAINLRAEKISSTQYTVTWDAPESGEYSGYKLYSATSVAGLASATPVEVAASLSASKTLTGTANGIYYIMVKTLRTVGSNTYETETDPICCSLALDAVKSLSATAQSTSSIKLSWTNPTSSGYEGIRIYRGSTLIAQSGSPAGFGKSSTSYTDTGLSANTNYTYTVTTYKTDSATTTELKAENIISRYTLANQVGSLTATANGPKSVTLTWTNPASGTWSRINIYKNGVYLDYWNPSHNRTSATYDVSDAGTAYSFEIRSLNGNSVINSTDSKTASVTTPTNPVTNLQLTARTTSSATISWTNPAGNYTGVKVYKKLSSSSSWGDPVATYTNKTTTTCSISSLNAGTRYDFKVESYLTGVSNVNGTSSASLTSIDTKPNVPGSFRATSQTTSSITYSWTKPSGGLSSYVLYYKMTEDSGYSSISLSNTATSYTISSLSQGIYYDAYLKSIYNSQENSTSVKKESTQPGTPGSFSVYINGTDTTISWSAPTNGVDQYYLYYKISSTSTYSSKLIQSNTTSYTFSNTDLSGGAYYNFYVTGYKNTVESAATSVKSIYTPPRAISFSTSPYIYQDDGMGTVTVRWVYYGSRSDISGVNVYLDNSYTTYVSGYSNGGAYTATIKIPNFTRTSSTSHSFKLEPYHNNNSYETKGPGSSYNITPSTGLLKINGTDYSFSKLVNVITSSVYVNDTKNRHPDGAFYKNRQIYLSKYSIGQYEITQEIYKAVMGTNPSSDTASLYYPVTHVNWYHAIAFCNKLSVLQGLTPCYSITGYTSDYWRTVTHSSVPTSSDDTWNKASFNQYANGYHLPTECQNEFAARGGMNCLKSDGTMNYDGTPWTFSYPGSETLKDVAWIDDNAAGLHIVGKKNPNSLNLFDMSGNVREWLTDWNNNPKTGTYYDPYCGYSTSDASGSSSTAGRLSRKDGTIVVKGGNWDSNSNAWVDSNGDTKSPTTRDAYTGFRICRNVTYQ